VGQTAIEKIVQRHMTEGPKGREVRAGDFVSLRPPARDDPRQHVAVMKKFKSLACRR